MRYGKIVDNKLIVYRPIDGFLTPHELKGQGYKKLNTEAMHNPEYAAFTETDTEITLTWEKWHKMVKDSEANKEIKRLKEELSSSDYKVIKCAEAQILELNIPYDINALHRERQEIRGKINELEQEVQFI